MGSQLRVAQKLEFFECFCVDEDNGSWIPLKDLDLLTSYISQINSKTVLTVSTSL